MDTCSWPWCASPRPSAFPCPRPSPFSPPEPSAFGNLHLYLVLGIGLVAMVTGDVILYFLGRVSGWALLGFLCRLSANPETCILRSAEYFYRRGKQTLLFAKFIPGINTMSPPLAGSMKMRLPDFLQYDALGTLFYVGAYSAAGYIFS